MAQILVPNFAVTIDGVKIVVTDKSGAYDVTTNPGGWGAPNAELDESVLVVCVIRKDSAGDQYLSPITNQYVYDPSAVNTKETSFELTYKNDGAHEFYIFKLLPSGDGLTYVAGGDIDNGDFFYYNNAIYEMVDGAGVAITAQDLIGEGAILSGTCSDFVLARLAIEAQAIYKEYRVKRETKYDDAETIFQDLLKLQQDLQGSTYAYYSGLKIEAQDQVESLLDKYQLNPS